MLLAPYEALCAGFVPMQPKIDTPTSLRRASLASVDHSGPRSNHATVALRYPVASTVRVTRRSRGWLTHWEALLTTPFPLVDLQVNGWHGTDFSAPDLMPDAVVEAAARLDDQGTAGFLATLVSAPLPTLHRNVALLADLAAGPLRGKLLGIHLEGPFIASDPRVLGAHRAAHVLAPDLTVLDALLDAGTGYVRLITIAAEVPGADKIICRAVRRGVTVSIGHSFATRDDLTRAAAAGATALTHWGNAVPALLDKRDNPLLASLLTRDLTPMVIADGHHLSTDLLALVLRIRGPADVVLVSDGAPVGGLPPGHYRVFDQVAELTPAGAVVNHGEGHLVGSASSLLGCVDVVASSGEVSGEDALAMASVRALELIGLSADSLDPNGPRMAWDSTQGALVRCV